MNGSDAIPLYAGCTPVSQTIVLPRYWSTQQDRPTSCPAPNIVTLSVAWSDMLGYRLCRSRGRGVQPGRETGSLKEIEVVVESNEGDVT